jgi:hypothetical protein
MGYHFDAAPIEASFTIAVRKIGDYSVGFGEIALAELGDVNIAGGPRLSPGLSALCGCVTRGRV